MVIINYRSILENTEEMYNKRYYRNKMTQNFTFQKNPKQLTQRKKLVKQVQPE